MANMLDYLVWRGDIGLDYAPFNEIDSLILASVSYLDFPPVAAPLSGMATIVPPPPETEISFIRETRALLSAAGMTHRLSGLMVHHPVSILDGESDMQFAAVTFDLPDGSHYVAFRGTDNSIVGWREDFTMAFESPVPAQVAAGAYLASLAAETEGPILLGGHSKGGNLAVYAAAHAAPEVQARIISIDSFDGPGLDEATMVSDGYLSIARRIRSFVPQSSVIGLLLAYHPEYTVVRADAVSILQHDTFTWQVLGTAFQRVTEVDISSQLVDQTVHAWLARVSREERRRFVDTLFDLLEATGATTMKELLVDVPGRAAAILRALQTVDLDTARMIVTLLGRFVSIGAQNVIEYIRQRIAPETRPALLPDNSKGDTGHE